MKRYSVSGLINLLSLCLLITLTGGCSTPSDEPAIGFVDTPRVDEWDTPIINIEGWVYDPDGIKSVKVVLNDQHVFSAVPKLKRADVLKAHPHITTDTPGFLIQADFTGLLEGQDVLAIYSVDINGNRTQLATLDWSGKEQVDWLKRASEVSGWDLEPFYLPVATSGLGDPQAKELVSVYGAKQNETFKIGLRIPVLYMRTTKGRDNDWVFDPDFNTETRSETGKLIAEDSLNDTLKRSIEFNIPVLITLNGGIWADASGTEPDWDLIDHLEEDEKNCQWTYEGKVFSDEYLSNLPGSTLSPELSRALTLNVFADEVRYYKKRNLQQAARIIANFAQEHPELFIGINLDPDVYINPFFEGKAWFDYNPDTLRQFRHWLAGTGPYSTGGMLEGEHLSPVLTLADVSDIAQQRFLSWEEVTPPKLKKGVHETPWQELWGQFRRHLVYQHYNDMANWVGEAGIDPYKIFTAQGFAATSEKTMPMPVHIMSPGKNYDTAGMSIEGSKPENGHLGAILYGDSAINTARMENDLSLFANIQSFDLDWGVPEFNLAKIDKPADLPGYDLTYQAVLELLNSNVRYVSPMAWNGSNGIFAGSEGFVSYTSWRNTPAEQAFMDFSSARKGLSRTAKLWPFGFRGISTVDGWTGSKPGSLHGENGKLTIDPESGNIRVTSPDFQLRYSGKYIIAIKFNHINEAAELKLVLRDKETGNVLYDSSLTKGAELISNTTSIGYEWMIELEDTDRTQLEIEIRSNEKTVVDHVAIVPIVKNKK